MILRAGPAASAGSVPVAFMVLHGRHESTAAGFDRMFGWPDVIDAAAW
jgi:hypothetical protein